MGGPTEGNAPQLLGGTAIKPKERKGFEAISYFIHNPETGEYFTRTPKSWALIILFYIIYYACLAGIWYGLLTAYFSTLPDGRPKFTLHESLIGSNPGLGIRPRQPDVHIDSSMVKLKFDDTSLEETKAGLTNFDWAKRGKTFLSQYDNDTGTTVCDDGVPLDDSSLACKFDVSSFGDCANFPYGYTLKEGESVISPCLYIKPNRIYEWVPESYNVDSIADDETIPENIKELIIANPKKLYVDCEGENPFDREGLEGNIIYHPKDQSIDFKYFPYVHIDGNYHNPAVAIQIKNPELGRLYHIECKLYGGNVEHHRKDREGLVHFEYLLE
ncbi:sodium/potassium-transporting ATPase subunit beta-1 [Lepeophtheirus salmonis]|uniref:Sodium/potassiumtransporting ATPase subunit beta2like [Apis mellifera] n=1 Tax=Lepeophtheirus salmonis TaxID=72036 RepID=A0A0K2TCF1_LEPSM|nr:sodium/potassium-transporting ATPase subunit beta-1-like [Lepeophtheirus salmonis]